MKHLLILLLFLTPLSILAQEVDFGNDVGKAKKQAAKEKKLIFIDFYTDWCKPCKLMDAEVFTKGEIADRMNAFFVNVKINADNDKYTASQFSINSYPTSLVLDSTGKVLFRSSGYGGATRFWRALETVLASTQVGENFIILKNEYESGRQDALFLKSYCRFRQAVGLHNEAIIDKLIETMPVDSQTAYAPIFIQSVRVLEGKGFDYLVERKAEKRFLQKLKAIVQLNYQHALAEKDKKKLTKVLEANKLVYDTPSVSDAENATLESGFYWQIKKLDDFHATILAYLKKMPIETALDDIALFSQKASDFGAFYFENIKNKKQLNAFESQLALINKSIAQPNLIKTHAKILYRLEQNDRAIALLEKAMDMASDKADFAEVLKQMKEKKL
jgi:thioredoxin-related protein